ncbi:hypothetical protein [Micromonospora sp. CPCC 206061]|uniref:hypothetical protein n=1 Tax=Micromonospora sp. CPCC 206061 TaxID=3122410 RepID=UPI002FF1E686
MRRLWWVVAGAAVVLVAAVTVVVALVEAADDGDVVLSAPRGDRDSATFELVSGATVVVVRSVDLGGDLYRISASHPDSPRRPEVADGDDVVRLALPGGTHSVDVRLNAAVTWHVRIAAGAADQRLDLDAGPVSGVDLAGGANAIDLALPPATGTLPVRVTGGAGQVSVRTAGAAPSRVRVGSGAAQVTVDGRGHTGVAGGTVFEPPEWAAARDRYDLDVAAGVSTLTVARG